MSALEKILPHYTYDDYCKWEGRWEIIEGIPYAMSPAPSVRHQWLSGNIITKFSQALENSSCGKHCKVYNFLDVKISEDTVVQPDVLVICGETHELYLDFPPVIVVEILSPSTRSKDQVSKLSLYRMFGVKYYMIVDPEINGVDILELTETNIYSRQSPDNANSYTFQINGHCGITLSLNKIWE